MTTEEDRRRVALDAAIRWSWSVLCQVERVEAIQGEVAADAFRGSPPAAYTQEHRVPFHRLRCDSHFLMIAGRNLLRALNALADVGVEKRLPKGLAEDVRLLRNCFEHWDEREEAKGRRGEAFRKFREHRPDDDPGSHDFGAGGTRIGGVEVNVLRDRVAVLHRELLELEGTDFVWRGWDYR